MARTNEHPFAVVLAHPTLNQPRKSTYSAPEDLQKLSITIPMPAEWLNSNDRRHRIPESKIVKLWRQASRDAAIGIPPIPTPVRVVATVWKAREGRYDPGNLYPTAKACVDGFTDAGLWPDDDHVHVIGPDMRHGGKGVPGLVFTFELQ